MTPTECVTVCKFIADRCPAMKVQDGTPEAWYLDLVEFDVADAMAAARQVTLDKAFISIGDLVTECRRIIGRRIGAQRLAQRHAEIAAENDGDSDVKAITSGGPAPEVWAEAQRQIATARAERLQREAAAEAERQAHIAARKSALSHTTGATG